MGSLHTVQGQVTGSGPQTVKFMKFVSFKIQSEDAFVRLQEAQARVPTADPGLGEGLLDVPLSHCSFHPESPAHMLAMEVNSIHSRCGPLDLLNLHMYIEEADDEF